MERSSKQEGQTERIPESQRTNAQKTGFSVVSPVPGGGKKVVPLLCAQWPYSYLSPLVVSEPARSGGIGRQYYRRRRGNYKTLARKQKCPRVFHLFGHRRGMMRAYIPGAGHGLTLR